jgi:hypothetical protein
LPVRESLLKKEEERASCPQRESVFFFEVIDLFERKKKEKDE